MATKRKQTKKIPAADRIRFLRRKVAAGEASDDEEKELERLSSEPPATLGEQLDFGPDANPISSDANPISEEPAADANPISPDEANPISANPISPEPPKPPVAHRLKSFVGKLPKPGATRVAPKANPISARGSDDWTKPYVEALKGAGRETTVLFIAGHAMGILKGMSDAIKSVGVKPLIDIESNEYKAALVLTVHTYLPSSVVVKPEHILAFGGVVLTGQTFYHRKAITAEAQKQKDREAMAKRTRERIENANQISVDVSASDPKPDLSNVVPMVAIKAVPDMPDAPSDDGAVSGTLATVEIPAVPTLDEHRPSAEHAGF